MFCNKCGAEIEDTAVFCSQCGNSILGGEQAAKKEISSGARAAQRKTIDAICVLLAAVVVTGIILVQRIINNCYIKPMPLPLH